MNKYIVTCRHFRYQRERWYLSKPRKHNYHRLKYYETRNIDQALHFPCIGKARRAMKHWQHWAKNDASDHLINFKIIKL